MPDKLNGQAWRKLRAKILARAKRDGEPCWICHRPIDWDAPPCTTWSPSVDHLEPRSLGGATIPPEHLLAPAHHGCNSGRGNGRRRARATRRPDSPVPRW